MTMEERVQQTQEEQETRRGTSQLAHLNTVTAADHSKSGVDDYGEYWDDVPDDLQDESSHASGNHGSGWLRVLSSVIVLYGVFSLGAWVAQRSTRPPLVGPIAPTALSTDSMTNSAIVVHVTGRVHKPGVYTLPPNARVRDAVQKAGGPLRDADINAINLAAWAEDGTKIDVPAKPPSAPVVANVVPAAPAVELTEPVAATAPASPESEVEERVAESPALSTPAPETPARNARRSGERAAPRTRASARSAKAKVAAGVPLATTASGNESVNASPEYLAKHPLNLNRARAEQLEVLPGIGPSLAQKIVAYREQNGGFKSVDDLDNVSGIGPKKLEALRSLVTVK
jgi:competence protein ComEA